MGTIIKSIEYYLPEQVLTNKDLQKENPEWEMDKVTDKSGVNQRHIAKEGETALDLSIKACDKIFQNMENDKNDINGIIYCTQSPDFIIPGNSFILHKYLDLSDLVFTYDFNRACDGYICGLAMAHSFISSGMATQILFVTADTYSKYINKRDRSTRSLFGDGAAVTIVERSDERSGIIDIDLASWGKYYDKFYIPAGGSRLPMSRSTSKEKMDDKGNIRSDNDILMEGMEVWGFINSEVPKQINRVLKRNKLEKSNIDMFVFHQASRMTLESLIRILRLEREKVFINLTDTGNTVSSSIPIALKDAIDQGKILKGQKVLLGGFGVGMSCGVIFIEM